MWCKPRAQQSGCLRVVRAAPSSNRGEIQMTQLWFLCVFPLLWLWLRLSCQAEMTSCGSEPPSWKSSSQGRVRIWPLCFWGFGSSFPHISDWLNPDTLVIWNELLMTWVQNPFVNGAKKWHCFLRTIPQFITVEKWPQLTAMTPK